MLGPESVEASRVALAAKPQLTGDRLFEYHTKLLETRGQVNGARALAVAREMGLDVERLKTEMDSPEVRETLQENVGLGDKLGLSGTPAFVVGDAVFPGAVGADPLRRSRLAHSPRISRRSGRPRRRTRGSRNGSCAPSSTKLPPISTTVRLRSC